MLHASFFLSFPSHRRDCPPSGTRTTALHQSARRACSAGGPSNGEKREIKRWCEIPLRRWSEKRGRVLLAFNVIFPCPMAPCICLRVPMTHQQKSRPHLSNGMMLPPTTKHGRRWESTPVRWDAMGVGAGAVIGRVEASAVIGRAYGHIIGVSYLGCMRSDWVYIWTINLDQYICAVLEPKGKIIR